MFLLNSCLGHFSAACSRRHPFSRSYGVILPSSLTTLLPPALGFSPHPPVSVYGTGTVQAIAAFLGSQLMYFPTLVRYTSRLQIVWRICLPYSYLACTRLSIPRPCSLPSALGFSPHPPVSVYGTGTVHSIAAFLGTWLTCFPTMFRSTSRLRIAIRFFLYDSYLACTRLSIPRPCSPHASPQF